MFFVCQSHLWNYWSIFFCCFKLNCICNVAQRCAITQVERQTLCLPFNNDCLIFLRHQRYNIDVTSEWIIHWSKKFFYLNLKVILANVQSMRRTLEDMERCKGEVHLPQGAEESLLVCSRAKLLLQQLEELEHLTEQQARLLEVERNNWFDLLL